MVANKQIHLPNTDSLLQISPNKPLEQSTLTSVTIQKLIYNSSNQTLKEGGGRRVYGGISGHGGKGRNK